MKKLLIAGIVLLGLIGYAKADANTVLKNIGSVPGKLPVSYTHLTLPTTPYV